MNRLFWRSTDYHYQQHCVLCHDLTITTFSSSHFPTALHDSSLSTSHNPVNDYPFLQSYTRLCKHTLYAYKTVKPLCPSEARSLSKLCVIVKFLHIREHISSPLFVTCVVRHAKGSRPIPPRDLQALPPKASAFDWQLSSFLLKVTGWLLTVFFIVQRNKIMLSREAIAAYQKNHKKLVNTGSVWKNFQYCTTQYNYH